MTLQTPLLTANINKPINNTTNFTEKDVDSDVKSDNKSEESLTTQLYNIKLENESSNNTLENESESGSILDNKSESLDNKSEESLETPVNNNNLVKFDTKEYLSNIFYDDINIKDVFKNFGKDNHLKILENVVCVEGNIGCGKSTLLKQLQANGYIVLQEPVKNSWYKYLPLLYSESTRWACTFQFEVLHWFNTIQNVIVPELIKNKTNNKPIIIERSPQTGFYVFLKNLYETKTVNEWEVSIIRRFYDIAAFRPEGTIYLQVPADTCCGRIEKRNRNSEDLIPTELIIDLHKKHEESWANNDNDKIYCIDSTQNVEKVAQDTLEKLNEFLKLKNQL